MIVNILSNNFSGETTTITFSPSTGGTSVITGATIPYEYTVQWGYGDYSIYSPTYDKTCPLSVPEPTFTASILPTGVTQFENVILTGSTDLTNPVYNWTLTDFFDVSGNSITSYVGNPLTEGYFSSTAGTVSMTAVGEDDYGNTFSATTSGITISAFDLATTSPDLWYDPTDVSTLTLRNDGSNDYVEAIDNKGVLTGSTGMTLTQSVAADQPLYSASTLNGSLNVLYGDGISNVLSADYGSVISSISGRTSFFMGKLLDKRGQGFPNNDSIIYFPLNTLSNEGRYLAIAASGTKILNNGSYSTRFRELLPYSGQPELYTWIRENNVGLAEAEYNGETNWDDIDTNIQPYNFRYVSIMNSAGGTSDMWGEFGEWIHYHRTITDAEKQQIDRYLHHKWFGNQIY